MLLKSALIKTGMTIANVTKNKKLEPDYAWGHDLRGLSQTLAERREDFKQVLEQRFNAFPESTISYLDTFDAYFDQFRYPKTPKNSGGLKTGDLFGGPETGDLLTQLFNLIRPFAFQLPTT